MFKILIIVLLTVLYTVGGIFLENHVGVKSCAFYAWYGFMFGFLGCAIQFSSFKKVCKNERQD